VQWQRGPLSKTTLQEMKSYIDTTLAHNNIWLVLVYHGINGLGWEALPDTLLDRYFQYIKQNENNLWIATFKDVAKYMRERMHAAITQTKSDKKITVHFSHSLREDVYNLPLTLKTYIPSGWKKLRIVQNNRELKMQIKKDENGAYVLYDAIPGKALVRLNAL
jgi:hypothetical protein